MPKSEKELNSIVFRQLTPEECEHCVAYTSLMLLTEGTSLSSFHTTTTTLPWNAYMAFVDRHPAANWGHSARCILIHEENDNILSLETHFPPFHLIPLNDWHIAYRASGVPDAALLTP